MDFKRKTHAKYKMGAILVRHRLVNSVGNFSGDKSITFVSPKRPDTTYEFSAELDMGEDLKITVSVDRTPIALFEFETLANKRLRPLMSDVDHDHQRVGLASRAYDWAEELTGFEVIPSSDRSPEAVDFWRKRKP